MVDLEQVIKVKWATGKVKYYKDLGYEYTGVNTELYVKVKHLPYNSQEKVRVSCDDCGFQTETPYRNYNRIIKQKGAYRCRKCNAPYTSQIRINNNKESCVEKFNSIIRKRGDIPIATQDDYTGSHNPMPFLCKEHGRQFLSLNQLQQGNMCPECGAALKGKHTLLSLQEVEKRISEKNGDKLLNPQDYININTRNLKIQCSCGEVFITNLASFMNCNGYCPKCAKRSSSESRLLSQKEIIKRCTINGECYILNPQDYINIAKRNLKFRCLNCDNIFVRDLSHYDSQNGKWCPECSRNFSVGEYEISCFLNDNNITYERQKRFPNCKYKKALSFDFYLPTYNTCIEFDGIQHYQQMPYDTDSSFELRKKRDNIKTTYCTSNDIYLIRIPYYEHKNIEKILIQELNL